jgi:hypothetical protein
VKPEQGDQIQQSFAHWVIVNLGQFSKITEVARIFAFFFRCKSYKLI